MIIVIVYKNAGFYRKVSSYIHTYRNKKFNKNNVNNSLRDYHTNLATSLDLCENKGYLPEDVELIRFGFWSLKGFVVMWGFLFVYIMFSKYVIICVLLISNLFISNILTACLICLVCIPAFNWHLIRGTTEFNQKESKPIYSKFIYNAWSISECISECICLYGATGNSSSFVTVRFLQGPHISSIVFVMLSDSVMHFFVNTWKYEMVIVTLSIYVQLFYNHAVMCQNWAGSWPMLQVLAHNRPSSGMCTGCFMVTLNAFGIFIS